MKNKLKKIALSSSRLTDFMFFIRRLKLSLRKDLILERGSKIGFSSKLGGHNFFGKNSILLGSEIGLASYISENSFFMNTKIGKFCSIGQDVRCIIGKHPSHTFVSSHPAFFSLRKQAGFTFTKQQLFDEFADPITQDEEYSIVIGNDVWIGAHTKIIDGVKIGDGAIVAACSLVNKNVPPYTIYGGVPAKFIKSRFDEEQVSFLQSIKWWNKDWNWLSENAQHFVNITDFKEKFKPNGSK